MLWTFVTRAVTFRKRRLLLAFGALTVAATLATALFSVYADIERKIRGEFRGYGANLIVVPGDNSHTVPLEAIGQTEQLGAAVSPVLFSVGRVEAQSIGIAGVDFARAKSFTQYWRVEGAGVAGTGDCLAGGTAAKHFHWSLGQTVALEGSPCVLRGIVSTGGAEDNQLVLPFGAVARFADVSGVASVIEVRADGSRLEEMRKLLQLRMDKLTHAPQVRIVRAVAETEAGVVLKVRGALFLLTAMVLLITALCVTSNFSELVIERSKEIGVLKAIGAPEGRIAALLAAEAITLAVLSALAGYAAGISVAAWIGRSIFSGRFHVTLDPVVLLSVAAVTLGVSMLATLVAAQRIWRIEPAVILRGE